MFVVANLAVLAVLLGGPLVVLVFRSFDAGAAIEPRRLPRARQPARDSSSVRAAVEAIRNSLVFALDRHGDRRRGRRSGGVRDRDGLGRATRSLDVLLMLPARHIGGHRRFRVPDRARPAAARPADIAVAHPHRARAVAIPFVVRAVVPALRSIDPRLREAAARARRVAARVLAGGRPSDRRSRTPGRCRVRGRGVAR